MTLKSRVREIAALSLGMDASDILDDMVLFVDHADREQRGSPSNSPGDSLDRIEFIMAIEEEFGIDVPESAPKSASDTVAGMAAYLEEQRSV